MNQKLLDALYDLIVKEERRRRYDQDPLTLVSMHYWVIRAVGLTNANEADVADVIRCLQRRASKEEKQTRDVFATDEALGLIRRALW